MGKTGKWWLRSNSDPRFNKDGYGVVHALELPAEAREWLQSQAQSLQAETPRDLEYGFQKD